jgi:hypothetical protein
MADIGDHDMLLDQQRDLQRMANMEIYRNMAESRWRNKQQDHAGENLYRTAALEYNKSEQMRDDHRRALIKDISVAGKLKNSYNSDDLMRTNYQGNYEQ